MLSWPNRFYLNSNEIFMLSIFVSFSHPATIFAHRDFAFSCTTVRVIRVSNHSQVSLLISYRSLFHGHTFQKNYTTANNKEKKQRNRKLKDINRQKIQGLPTVSKLELYINLLHAKFLFDVPRSRFTNRKKF